MSKPDPRIQAYEIFLAAIALGPATDRLDFLAQACGSDRELFDRVAALLNAHQGAGGSPPVQPADVSAEMPPTDKLPSSSYGSSSTLLGGRYRLLEQIGEGGMGSVWVAQQSEPVRRKVAVKLIKPGMDSRQVIGRFQAERQALALMDHPNIAKVFDGGISDQGRPYFVMEYVRGVPITEYCDQSRMALAGRLRLFVQVCQAVQHAHQKGIIHRDLKPSNILVCLYDGQPVPKVIDFGLAKATHQTLTEQTAFTAHGMMVGTPLYMSPEQAEFSNLDIDTRSDIYSLGVVLYELLTGSTPLERKLFKDAVHDEVLRVIKEVDPPRPSTRLSHCESLVSIAAQRGLAPAHLCKSMQGELDWIAMKALEKERSRRYETANGLARDIERYLNDEAVEARPPSALYRWRKFASKNRMVIRTAGILITVLSLATAVSAWLAIRAKHAEVVAEQRTIARDHAIAGQAAALREREQALQEAEGQRSAAVRNALQSEELVRTLTTERGLMAGERRETAIAARWFAESSRMAVSGVHERQVNLMRARTYGRQSLRPIMAFQHDTGEPGRVQRLTFSPDERMLASRVESPLYEWNDVRVWDLKSGQQLVIPKIPIATAVAWSPDGSILAAGDKSGHIVLMRENTVLAEWEVRTAGWSAIFENAANTVVELCFSPDGRHLAVGAGRQLLLWSVEDYSKPIRSHLHDDLILSIVFSPDGKMITTLSRDHIARLFSCADDWTAPKLERPSYVYPGGWDRPAPFRPRFLDGGKTWLTWPNCMSMTDLTAEQHRQRPLRGGYVAQVSPNERWLILGSYNHTNGIADVDSGVIENTINYGQNQGTASASFSPDGSIVCVGGTDGSMRTLRVPELSDVFPPIVGMSYVTYVEFAPSGRWLASAESGGMVRLWKYPRETDFRLVPFGMDSGHSFAEISDDDRFAIAVGQTDRECRLQSTRVIELESTEAVGATLVPGGILLGGKFLPKSPQVALISSTSRLFGGNFIGDGVVSVFNWRTGERLQERRLSPEPRSIDIHPQGHEAAVLTADGVVRILNLPDLTETFQWRAHAPYLENNWYNSNGHLLYSRDGRFLATCGRDRQVRIWDTAKRQLWHQVEHEGQSDEAAFSHDGRYLATSSWDKNEVRITDLETRTLAAPVQLLPDWVFQVSFSPDDQRLAAACRDRQVRVWNWRTGEPVGRPMKHPHEVHRASFANSGNWLLTVCDDGTVRIWDALTGLPLGPPVESMAVILPNLVITKDDRFAVLGGVNGRLQILALQSYLEAGQGEVNDELLAQLDLQGNIRLENGIEYPLTSAEAMHRFQQVSSGDADTSAVDGSDSRQLRWHAHYLAGARALDRKDTFAYLWNLQQQVALGSPIQILGQLDRDIDSADHLFVHDREYDRLLAIGAEQLTALSMPMPALPDLSSLCYRLAYWAGLTEKQARTLFDIESSTNLTPDETVKTAILGALQFRAGEHSKALELLRQAADMGYSGVDQALIESMALHHQGDRARSEVLLMLAAAWIHEPSSSPDGISVRLLREARTLLGHTELIIDWERLGREVTEDVVQSLIPKPPRSIDDYRRRIALWAACGNYGQAEKELIKAMRIDNTAAILWVELATTKLARDDVKGFRDVLSQFIATQFNPETSDLTDSDFVHVVELAILFPGGDANFLSGIDQAVGNSPLDRFLNGIGALSLYRQGKYTEAIQLLDANVQNNSISASANDAFSEEKRELLRSMCRFRLDPNDQTRSEVVAALEGWRRRHREWSKNSPWLLPWTVRIRNRYLEREVEQLIETVASTDD